MDREKQLPLEDAIEVTRQVANALAYAHVQGIVHRDVKPANILIHAGQAMVSDRLLPDRTAAPHLGPMRHRGVTQLLAAALAAGIAPPAHGQAPADWPIHSTSRPQPPVVDPGPFTASAPPPSDAVVLFDGRSLDNWRSADDAQKPARWLVRDGYTEVVAGTGAISTAQAFGDVQLHVEWMTPTPASGEGQNRGNSGVFLMGRYEVQVLDSYQNQTYPDGQAGAIYGQYPPLVNASRPPGEWQTYDIVFLRPRFDANGRLVRPARITVFHNGVLVQNDVTLTGPSAHRARRPYSAHADALPLVLQDHGQPVRYRNIWARPLAVY